MKFTTQHNARHQANENTCPKERAIPSSHNSSGISSSGVSTISSSNQQHHIMTKQTMKFNWKSNWETLLVFVIIVVGIVITTIAAIRSKDKHLLVIPDESGDYGSSGASVQVPSLPQTDFQLKNDAHVLLTAGSQGMLMDPGESLAGRRLLATRKPVKSSVPAQAHDQQHAHRQRNGQLSKRQPPGAGGSDAGRTPNQTSRDSEAGAPEVASLALTNHRNQHAQADTQRLTTGGRARVPSQASSLSPTDNYDALSTESTPSQVSGGSTSGDSEDEPATDSSAQAAAKQQKNGRRIANGQQQKITGSNLDQGNFGDRETSANPADDFHTTRSASASVDMTADGGATEQATTTAPHLQGPYELVPSVGNANKRQQQQAAGNSRLSQLKLGQLQVPNSAGELTPPPPPPPPPPPSPTDTEDFMGSYTRTAQNASNPNDPLVLSDYNASATAAQQETNYSSLLADNQAVNISDYNQLLAATLQGPAARTQRPPTGSVLPFSLLLNDLIRLAKPTPLIDPLASLNQPANSRPPSNQYSILQQLRSLPAPLLALFHGATGSHGGASSSSSGSSSAHTTTTTTGHEPSESSHYQRISMSPSDLSMLLSRSLRSTNPLPAFPPPMGVPQSWVPPNSGGVSVLNDAASSNADFVAGNTAGFLRDVPSVQSLASGSGESQQTLTAHNQAQLGSEQQQQQKQPQQQQQQSYAASHPLVDSTIGDVSSQQVRQQFTGPNNNQQAGTQATMQQQQLQQQQQQQQQQQFFNGNQMRPAMDVANQKIDEAYGPFKSVGTLGSQLTQLQQQQPTMIQYPMQHQQQQINMNNLQNAQAVNNMRSSQQRPLNSGIQLFQNSLTQDLTQPPVYSTRQIYSEIPEPTAHVPLGYTVPQQQQQQQGNNPLRQTLFDFSAISPVESAPRASISALAGGVKPVSQQGNSAADVRVQQQPTRGAESARPASSAVGGAQSNPITLNAISRMRRSLDDKLDDRIRNGDSGERNSLDDEEEEYLDSRPMSVVSPDGRPMSDRAVKMIRNSSGKIGRGHDDSVSMSSQRQTNHMDLSDSAPLNHYAASKNSDTSVTRESGGQSRRRKKNRMRDANELQVSGKRQKAYHQVAPEDSTATTKSHRGKNRPSGHQLEAAGSGLMSKLLGVASTNDELDDDSDGGGRSGVGDDDEESANERRKEELEDAEFGIVSDRPSSSSTSADGPSSNDINGHMNEVSRLIRDGPSGNSQEGAGSPRDSSIGSAGSTDSNSYARRQQQQQRSDVEFYGHPGEETRQLKYGILGSGNYEVVNGGIYPDIDESTAAVNSVANYVRKPSVLLAGLPKLLAAGVAANGGGGGQHQSAFMPGGRVGVGGNGGFMRGASAASPEEIIGLFPSSAGQEGAGDPEGVRKLLTTSPLLDMLSGAGEVPAGGYFDPSLMSQLGSSGTSAQSIHTSRDQKATSEDGDDDKSNQEIAHNDLSGDDNQDAADKKRKRKLSQLAKYKRKHAASQAGATTTTTTTASSALRDYESVADDNFAGTSERNTGTNNNNKNSGTRLRVGHRAGKRDELMTPLESLSDEANNRIRLSVGGDSDLHNSDPAEEGKATATTTSSQSTGSKSQGTNQFYSYQLLPSKKVTIFSDQDLDSAPSEQVTRSQTWKHVSVDRHKSSISAIDRASSSSPHAPEITPQSTEKIITRRT